MTTSSNADQTGPETWVPEAIAEQEEYIKRFKSCRGIVGTPHAWGQFAAAPGIYYRACTRCRVTETRADYATKRQA